MREEIAAAVVFITRLVRKNEDLSKEKVEQFSDCLSKILVEKFKNHWYRDNPLKGQGYRCIRVNETEPIDPVLERAARESGLTYADLKLPPEFTLWVDPQEVCCRFGENIGSYCTVAEFRSGEIDTQALQINIENMLTKHRQRKNAETKIQEATKSTPKNHHKIRHHNSLNKNKLHSLNVYNSHISNKKKPVSSYQSSVTEMRPDRFHWVRGADLVKA